MTYLVAIKRSARRANGAVGEAVLAEGAHHRFESRATADEWAVDLTDAGGRRVWVQDAPPHDRSDVDGYLVARRARSPVDGASASGTSGTGGTSGGGASGTDGDDAGEQATLARSDDGPKA